MNGDEMEQAARRFADVLTLVIERRMFRVKNTLEINPTFCGLVVEVTGVRSDGDVVCSAIERTDIFVLDPRHLERLL